MAGESQKTPSSEPDPSTLTTQQLDRGLEGEREYTKGQVAVLEQRLTAIDTATRLLNETINRVPTDLQSAIANLTEVFNIKLETQEKIDAIRETYRLELKADAEKALTTAMTAAEKAVQAALAAAEKARDQQTIASQLATDKSELRLIDALGQQQETFTVAIANIVEGLSEVKVGLSDINSERRGGKANQASIYAGAAFVSTMIGILIVLAATGVFAR